MTKLIPATATAAALAMLVLAGCGTSPATTPASSTSASASSSSDGKPWTVDTSGWWVPSDPVGCLNETTTCKMTVWKTRKYAKGNQIYNLMTHGETITLFCKAPTPAAIFNSRNNDAVYWYFADYKGATYWIPDIYVTDSDVKGMADGVPDCPSDTPGVNG